MAEIGAQGGKIGGPKRAKPTECPRCGKLLLTARDAASGAKKGT
jgi:hypothetical protein